MKSENISRKIKADGTKKRIYESAEALFNKYGFEGVSVDSITEAAGVAKGSFYVHFESKEALIADFINYKVIKMDDNFKKVIGSFPAGAPISAIMLSLLDVVADNTVHLGYELAKNAYAIQLNRNTNYDLLILTNRDVYGMIRGLIKTGMEQGEFNTGLSADVLAGNFVSMVRGYIFEWIVKYPDFDLKENLKTHFEILLAGLKDKSR